MNCFTDHHFRPENRGINPSQVNNPIGRASLSVLRSAIAGGVTLLMAATWANAQFGAQPVGAISGNQAVTVTATVAGTVSGVQVLTLGSAGEDFAVGTGASNCAAANLAVGGTCTESVTFTPSVPGLRKGAVVLVGTVSGQQTVLGTAYISGTGAGGLGVLVAGNVLPVAGVFGLYTGAVGDGQPATAAELYLPGAVTLDGAGNMYIADAGHNRIRMVCASATSATIQGTSCAAGAGIISTIAGNGNPAYTGDDGPAASATLNNPGYVALDGAGNLYIADSGNNVIRVITAATGVITTVAGNAGGAICSAHTDAVGDGCAATQATLNLPEGVTPDGSGNLYIADTDNHRIREVTAATGIITTVAGDGFVNANGTGGYNGDGIAATSAELNFPFAVAFDAAGNMYIPDSMNNRVREVKEANGQISTIAGTGTAAATACNTAPQNATQAVVWSPEGVAVDAAGNVYIAETQNAAIRKVSAASGQISTEAEDGCGDYYYGGQFQPQVLYGPTGLYLDGSGNLYLADTLEMVVQEIQGNFAALDFTTSIFQGQTSAPQTETVENDGNATLDLTTIAPSTNAAVDTAVANSCSNSETLAVNVDCEVGAEFAPALTPVLTGPTNETPNIDVGEDSQPTVPASNSPLDIELVGTALPVNSTTTTVASNPNPSGFGQNVTFTVTVTTGSGSLTGTVSITDTFNGTTTTLASGLAVNGAGVATFSISTLAVGQHSITASYINTNDPSHGASTSAPPLIQTVLEGTTVTLVSSVNPSTVGQSVTFTATVVTPGGGGQTPTGTVTFYDGTTALSTQNLNASGVATYSTATLANGVHQMTAEYNGNPAMNVLSSTSAVLSQDVQANATIAVISSLNPSNYGNPVTFTATVMSSATVAATGTVTFLDNGTVIGTGSLSGGAATFTISTLIVGTHPITVTYPGDAYNTAASSAAPLSQVVKQTQTVSTVTAAPTPGIAGTSETITGTVQLSSGTAPLSGMVTFTSGTATLGSAMLNGSGVATITTTLAAGSYQIVATYGGNANGATSASAALPYSVVLATTQTALTVTPNPASVLSPITFTATVTGNGITPTGTVNFLANGTVIGSATLSGGIATFTDSALTPATYSITAVYLGDTNNATSTSPAVSETVQMIPTTTVLGSSSTTGATSGVILVAAVVNDGTGPEPTGTVTFYNGTTQIGSAPLDGTGVGTLTPNLTTGVNYTITAVYSGDTDHSPSTSSAITISGTPVGFNIAVTPPSVTVADSQNITVTVNLTSNGSFTDTIGLGCASLPAAVTCHFSAISVNLAAGGTASAQLTIDTNNPLSGGTTAAMNRSAGSGKFSLAGLFLPLSLCFGCIFWRLRRRNAGILTMVLALAFSAAALLATGCNSFSQSTASPGTYVIQVTGTGANTDLIHYQNITLDITQ